MAIIQRPSPIGELAKILGNVAGDVQKYRDIGTLAQAYEPYFDDPRTARAAVRNPQQAMALMKFKATEAKRKEKEKEEKSDDSHAIELLQAAKGQLETKQEIDTGYPIYERLRARVKGEREETQAVKALYKTLRQNKAIKNLGIVLPNATDESILQISLIDRALEQLGGAKGDAEEAEKKTEREEAPEERADRETREAQAPGELSKEQRQGAEDELDVQDVAAQAAPELQAAPTPDLEQDEQMDPAAIQMQQEMGQPPTTPSPRGLGGAQLPQQLGQISPQAQLPQQLGTRIPEGQQLPQGQSLAGLPSEALNIGRSAVAGAGGAPRQVGELAGLAQRGLEYLPIAGSALQAGREAGTIPDITALAQKLPAREQIFDALGGKKADAGTLERSIQNLAGDVPEQLAWAAMLGVAGGVPAMKTAVQRVFKNVLGAQGFGNMAKFLTEKVTGPGQFADGVKNAVSFMYAVGQGPTLKKVASDVYTEAAAELPDTLRVKDIANVNRVGAELHALISEGSSGFQGTNSFLFHPFLVGNGSYKQGLEALKQVEQSNVIPKVQRAASAFRKYLMDDLQSNRDVPQKAKDLFKQGSHMWREYKMAEDISNTISNSPQVQKLVKENKLKGLLRMGIYGITYPIRATGQAIGAGLDVGWRTMEGIYQWATDPNMRRYYNEVTKSAMEMDGADIAKGLQKMEKVYSAPNKQRQKKAVFSRPLSKRR